MSFWPCLLSYCYITLSNSRDLWTPLEKSDLSWQNAGLHILYIVGNLEYWGKDFTFQWLGNTDINELVHCFMLLE